MDVGLELDMFRDAYDSGVKASRSGDIDAAKRHFLKASNIMAELSEKVKPPLDVTYKERAVKLKYIAENITEKESASYDCDGNNETTTRLLQLSMPTEKISFDDIIGLDEAKAAIHRLLIDPLKNPEAYKKYGLKAGGFILLEGPPGTGKTTFAKAAACEIDLPFAEINANALVDSYIGKTGKNIDTLFTEARSLARKQGKPVVLFLDELDYLAQKRGGDNKTAAEAVPTLIKQMDGFSTTADDLVLIAATNIKSSLDLAVLSRFRNVINIPLPTLDERIRIFDSKLGMLEPEDKAALDLKRAAEQSEGFSGRDISQVALDLKNCLAARDAKIRAIDMPIGELLISLIEKRCIGNK